MSGKLSRDAVEESPRSFRGLAAARRAHGLVRGGLAAARANSNATARLTTFIRELIMMCTSGDRTSS